MKRLTTLVALASLAVAPAAFAKVTAADTQRTGDALAVTWTSPNPVDVYESPTAKVSLPAAKLVAHASTSGRYAVAAAGHARRYFVLVDTKDHDRVETAERLVPLEQGSNFRDVGGYAGAGGKHVRWGVIHRSGGQPMLSPADVDQVHALGLAELVDLRSSEERVLAPTRVSGVPYTAVGYSMGEIMGGQAPTNGASVYRNMPHLLAPQLRILFRDLLSGQAPVAYNCSAGQDRTGFTTALILTALGVSRADIVADYHLSTKYRRPEWEMPEIDPAAHPGDPAAQMFAQYRKAPNWKTPTPLMDADGKPFLDGAFAEIDEKWGSVDAYLAKEVGVTKADIAKLRAMYLE